MVNGGLNAQVWPRKGTDPHLEQKKGGAGYSKLLSELIYYRRPEKCCQYKNATLTLGPGRESWQGARAAGAGGWVRRGGGVLGDRLLPRAFRRARVFWAAPARAICPILARLPLSRAPPHPNTTTSLPVAAGRSAASAAARASGVWA